MIPSRYFWSQIAVGVLLFTTAQPELAENLMTTPYDRSMLGTFAKAARYDKNFPEIAKWPQDLSKARVTFDQLPPSASGIDEEYLRKALSTFCVCNGDDWRHCYSHVGFADLTGDIELSDKTRIRWLIRQGGLALILYPDGGIVYLAHEISPNWKTVARSTWAKVAVERKLYRKEGSDRFFVHVKIFNISNHLIAFDTTKNVFYPNQWVESKEPIRQTVDERRCIQKPLSEAETKYLLDSANGHNQSPMIMIKAGEYYEYFISFNSGNYNAVLQTKFPYLILVMDGNIPITDGKSVQRLSRGQQDMSQAEVPIATPISLSALPKSANVLFNN